MGFATIKQFAKAAHFRLGEFRPAGLCDGPIDRHLDFAAPYASYQRGANENTNGLIRRYLPKGTSFKNLTQQQLDQITEELNNRPRKCLGYRTPNQVFQEHRDKWRLAFGA